MKAELSVVSVFVVCVCSWSTASADLFTVEDNLVDGTFISVGNSVSGSFDLNPVIPNNGEYNVPYDVTSAFYTFTFEDDEDLRYTNGYTDLSVSQVSYNYRVYRRYTYRYYQDELERLQVNLEGQYSYDQTTWYQMQEYEESSSVTPYYAYYTYEYDRTSGYTGSMTITKYLGTSALASLSADGIVDFTLAATFGDFYYTGGTLTADIVANPVPVPTAVLLGGIGLGMANWRLRKRKTAA